MECNMEEALRAKEIAEKKFESDDFAGARRLILKAQELYPGLENVPQMLAVCDVHSVAQRKVDGSDTDWYGILQVEPTADDVSIKKQYRKFALLLHPDKNKFCGAEAAFKLVADAMAVLSNQMKRKLHDIMRRATINKNATSKSSRFQFDPSNGHFGMKQSNRPTQSGIHVRMQKPSGINVRVRIHSHSGIRVSVQTKSEANSKAQTHPTSPTHQQGFSKQGTNYRGKGSTTPFIPVHPRKDKTDKGSGTPSNPGHQFGADARVQTQPKHQQGFSKQRANYRGKGSTTPFIPVHPRKDKTDKGSGTPSNPGHQFGADARVQTQPKHQQGFSKQRANYRGKGSTTPFIPVHPRKDKTDKGSGTPSNPGHQSGANARVQTQPTAATYQQDFSRQGANYRGKGFANPSSLVHQMDKVSGTPSSPVPLAGKGSRTPSGPIIIKKVVDIIITVIGFIIMGIPLVALNCVFYAIFKRIL